MHWHNKIKLCIWIGLVVVIKLEYTQLFNSLRLLSYNNNRDQINKAQHLTIMIIYKRPPQKM